MAPLEDALVVLEEDALVARLEIALIPSAVALVPSAVAFALLESALVVASYAMLSLRRPPMPPTPRVAHCRYTCTGPTAPRYAPTVTLTSMPCQLRLWNMHECGSALSRSCRPSDGRRDGLRDRRQTLCLSAAGRRRWRSRPPSRPWWRRPEHGRVVPQRCVSGHGLVFCNV